MQAGPRCDRGCSGVTQVERVGVGRRAHVQRWALGIGHVGPGASSSAWQELGLERLAESHQLIPGNRPHPGEDEKAQEKCEI